MITLPIAEFEDKSQENKHYEGFGVANINELNDVSLELQYEPEARDFKLITSLGHLLCVTKSLIAQFLHFCVYRKRK